MKKMIAVASLSLIPLMAQAESPDVAQNAAVIPAATVSTTSVSSEETGSYTWRALATGLGVVGGVIVVDLFMGGALTSSLFGWGTTVATGPAVYSPEVLSARAAGAVLGEMITPATNIRDVAARRDMFYALMLGVGGAVGAVVSYGLAGNSPDNDVEVVPAAK